MKRVLAVFAMLTCLAFAQPVSAATPRWITRVDRLIAGHPMSVVVGNDGESWYRHAAAYRRAPASNEKLLLSMALFQRFGVHHTFRVRAMATRVSPAGVVGGDLFLRGEGDPRTDDTTLRRLAAAIEAAGVTRISGRIVGQTGPFHRDWFAPGWKSYFPKDYVALPTALTFHGNATATGVHVTDPERRAATFLRTVLRNRGVAVRGTATAGPAIAGLHGVATVTSAPLASLVLRMNRVSNNFSAEVLGKALAYDRSGVGSIAAAAAAICGFETAHGVSATTCHDASGLSYANRQTALGIVRMLWFADTQPWAPDLRRSLPAGNQGTLKGRLSTVKLRAKTGTLDNVSALSGWVWSDAASDWIEFSLLTSGMDEWKAKDLEDTVVRLLANRANDPMP
jgi:serine-type D-Ala-D-Ala carboxypeptidase/endopeptidase (penicillin-binding protein 4)